MAFKRFINGFKFAISGFFKAIGQERNLRFHIVAAMYVFAFAIIFYNFSNAQYALLTVIICLVISLELVNSAIERVVNKILPQKSDIAKDIKDISASAVLIASIGAVFCGVFLFWDIEVIKIIINEFATNLLAAIALALTILVSAVFVFRK